MGYAATYCNLQGITDGHLAHLNAKHGKLARELTEELKNNAAKFYNPQASLIQRHHDLLHHMIVVEQKYRQLVATEGEDAAKKKLAQHAEVRHLLLVGVE